MVTVLKSPTSAVNTGASPDIAWSNLSNIFVSDNNDATASLGKNAEPQPIRVTGFNFGSGNLLQPTSKILGVQLAIKRHIVRRFLTTGNATDQTIQLTIGGQNKASTSNWPLSTATATYGGATDLWGNTSISGSQVLQSSFGVNIDVNGNGGQFTLHIDYVSMTIYYVTHNIFVRQNGVWVEAKPNVRQSGAWGQKTTFVRQGGVWIPVFEE